MKRSYDKSTVRKCLNLMDTGVKNNNSYTPASSFSSAYEQSIIDDKISSRFNEEKLHTYSDNSNFTPSKYCEPKSSISISGPNTIACEFNDYSNLDYDCYNLYNYKFNIEKVTLTSTSCFEFELRPNDCEIRVDTILYSYTGFLITGEVKDHCYNSVPNALVTLIRCKNVAGKEVKIKVKTSLSDNSGNFQFFIQDKRCQDEYKVVLGKTIF